MHEFSLSSFSFFFFNDPATTEIYTLSLHDALPIFASHTARGDYSSAPGTASNPHPLRAAGAQDRKSTRLNSSHTVISYAVFCLKKKKKKSETCEKETETNSSSTKRENDIIDTMNMH